jgi:Na+/melibiose symporter-like transporter
MKKIKIKKTKQKKKMKIKYIFYSNVQNKIIIFVLYFTCLGWIVLKLRAFIMIFYE